MFENLGLKASISRFSRRRRRDAVKDVILVGLQSLIDSEKIPPIAVALASDALHISTTCKGPLVSAMRCQQ